MRSKQKNVVIIILKKSIQIGNTYENFKDYLLFMIHANTLHNQDFGKEVFAHKVEIGKQYNTWIILLN